MITFYDHVQFFINMIKEAVSGRKSVTPVKSVENVESSVVDTEPMNESDIPSYDPDRFGTKKDYIKYISKATGITDHKEMYELIKDKADISLTHVRRTLKSMQ